jgi:DNA polymerase III epsilon subunit-like protein
MFNSFHDLVNSCNIKLHGNLKDTKDSIKNLAKFIDINIDKSSLDILCANLSKYKKYKNDKNNKIFYFQDKKIEINQEQQNIIFSDSNHHTRIIAGAGSGKTTTILCRIKYLLDNFITPNQILILTFNRNSCEDLKKKLKILFGFEMKIDIFTIDKFCNMLKYRYYEDNNCDKNKTNLYSLTELCIIGENIMEKYGKDISRQYSYVFFDEFQDVNNQQFNILKTFADNGCILTVIGDDNQNIYQFRGTDNYYIIHFDKIIKNTKSFHLTTNYRSSQEIVNLANKSINFNRHKIPKNMQSLYSNNNIPKLYLLDSTYSICKYIHKIIKKQIKKNNLKYDDFAILSRNGFPLKDYENYFIENKVPCVALLSNKNYDYNNKVSILKNHLTISTIHSSKGLEWEYVFIVGLCDEHFPSQINNNIKNIEEERRLFYVGATRAKNNLYFLASIKELPISRFLGEVYDNNNNNNNIKYKNKTKNKNLDLYIPNKNINDKNFEIINYGVTDLIISLSAEEIDIMKKENLIFTNIDNENIYNLYPEKLQFNKEITKKNLEPDFGIFCDLVMTRKIMLNSKQEINDESTLWILFGTELDNDEMEIYNMYDLQKYNCYCKNIFKNLKLDLDYEKKQKHSDIIKNIFQKINPKYEVRRKNTYPNIFLEQLKESYIKYCNLNLDNNFILRDIYFVSLSNKIRSNRKRLIYMDVFNIFMDGFDIINNRINDYADKIKYNANICKSFFSHQFDESEYILSGELDLLDKNVNDNNYSIIDFKCSNDDIKLEWIIQLLLYYSLFRENYNNKINSLKIFNIMNGKVYKFNIPINYDHKLLLNFIEKVICNIANSNRQKIYENIEMIDSNNCNFDLKPKFLLNNYANINNNINANINNNSKKNIIVLDVETNCEKGEIIQISYIIFDEKYNIVEKVNKYIKDRLVSTLSQKVNKITNKILIEKGEIFDDVMQKFLKDLSDCKIIVGHNIESDCRIINKNYSHHIDLFQNKELYCTMKNSKEMCKLKNINGHIKNPKLEELYYNLFKKIPENCHDSMKDVEYTAECYFYMKFRFEDILEIIKNIDTYNDILFRLLNVKLLFL